MIVKFEQELPCAQYRDCSTEIRCGEPTIVGVFTPTDDGIWEVFPVCERHLREAMDDIKIGRRERTSDQVS